MCRYFTSSWIILQWSGFCRFTIVCWLGKVTSQGFFSGETPVLPANEKLWALTKWVWIPWEDFLWWLCSSSGFSYWAFLPLQLWWREIHFAGNSFSSQYINSPVFLPSACVNSCHAWKKKIALNTALEDSICLGNKL